MGIIHLVRKQNFRKTNISYIVIRTGRCMVVQLETSYRGYKMTTLARNVLMRKCVGTYTI